MTKSEIISKIRQIAAQDGKPPGRGRFEKLTGITVWNGKYWRSWGDALLEAGYAPNQFQGQYDRDQLINVYLNFAQELERIPSVADLNLKARAGVSFPNPKTFRNHFGKKNDLLRTMATYAKENNYPDALCALIKNSITPEKNLPLEDKENKNEPLHGYVYLLKSGKYYKIGRTNSLDRRQYEIGLHLPEEIQPIHSIETDDPSGIEAYWHNRFKEQRMKGEWFTLSPSDIRAFRKRKFM